MICNGRVGLLHGCVWTHPQDNLASQGLIFREWRVGEKAGRSLWPPSACWMRWWCGEEGSRAAPPVCTKTTFYATLILCCTSELQTLEHNSNRFWKLQCSATTFIFLLILEIGHVTTFLTTYCMDPDRYNHPYLVFLYFLVKLSDIFFLGYMQRTLTWTLKQCPIIHQLYVPSLFFSDFSDILSSETSKFPFLDMYPGPWKHSLTILTTFPIFIAIFHWEMQMFPYLEMHTGPWTSQQSPIFFSFFFLF